MRKEMLINAAKRSGIDTSDEMINKLQLFSLLIKSDMSSNAYTRKVPRNSYGEANYNPMLNTHDSIDAYIVGVI